MAASHRTDVQDFDTAWKGLVLELAEFTGDDEDFWSRCNNVFSELGAAHEEAARHALSTPAALYHRAVARDCDNCIHPDGETHGFLVERIGRLLAAARGAGEGAARLVTEARLCYILLNDGDIGDLGLAPKERELLETVLRPVAA
jgi:hypothetical protein